MHPARSNARLLFVAVALLLLVLLWRWTSGGWRGGSSRDGVSTPPGGEAAEVVSSAAGEVQRPAARGRRPELKSLGGGPEKVRELASSGVHALIPAGHCLVTGGYATGNGRFGFVVLKPTWLELPSGGRQIRVESTILNLDQEALTRTGLDSLVTGEQKTIQNAEVWTPEDVSQTLGGSRGMELVSSPSILTTPGASSSVRMANEWISFMLDLEVAEAADGGFEVKSEIKLLE